MDKATGSHIPLSGINGNWGAGFIFCRLLYFLLAKHTHVVKNNDIYVFNNNSYLTFSGLARIVHKVIWNFVKAYPKVSSETIDWRNELPGISTFEIDPKHWVWQADGFLPEKATKRLQGFFALLIDNSNQLPDMRPLLDIIVDLLPDCTPDQKISMYCLYKLYNSFIKEESRSTGYTEFTNHNDNLLSICHIENMATLALPIPLGIDIRWESDDCEAVIRKYEQNKFKGNHIRLPGIIETMVYINMANSFKDESNIKQKEWLERALYNCTGNKFLQNKIVEHIKSLDILDTRSLFLELKGSNN